MKTIEEIRHQNFLALIDRFGGIQPLADALERSHSQLSQWKTRAINSGTGKPRNISGNACRYMETKLGLPRLWMDMERENDKRGGGSVSSLKVAENTRQYHDWPFRNVTLARLQALPLEALMELDATLDFHVSQWEKRTVGPKSAAT